MTLTEFLLVRIAEDEAAAKGVRTGLWDEIGFHDLAADDVPHVVNWSPARVLAEVEAKRRIVAEHRLDPDPEPDDHWLGLCSICDSTRQGYPCRTLRILAVPYADHPDYRQEWKP